MTPPLLAAVLVVVALVAAVGWNATAPSPLRTGVVVLVAVGWLLVNKPVEGPVLLAFTDERGLTVSDLLSLLCSALAIAAMVRRTRQPSGEDEPGHSTHDGLQLPAAARHENEGDASQGSASWRRQHDR